MSSQYTYQFVVKDLVHVIVQVSGVVRVGIDEVAILMEVTDVHKVALKGGRGDNVRRERGM